MDFKSALQEALQASGKPQPVYALVKEEGPEHKKTFTVEARLPEPGLAQFVGRAEGATKKRAEQDAARQVLEHLSKLQERRPPGRERSSVVMSWSEKLLSGDWPATIQSVAGTVVIAVFVVTFLAQAFTIPSESMEQTLLIGDYLLVDKLCYGNGGILDRLLPYRKVRRGDVIVFHYPVNPSQAFVKRVVAVPGDRLRLINKRVYVNGVPLEEPYVQYISNLRDPYRDDFPRTDAAGLRRRCEMVERNAASWLRITNSSFRRGIILCWETIATTAKTAAIGDLCRAQILSGVRW